MSVPGVSGGTMAILLGIYDKLIGAISNFHKNIKANALYLGKFTAAVGLGIGSLAFVLKWLLETFTIPVSAFFVGAVFGGIPALYQKTKIKPFSIVSVLYFLLGFGVVLATSYLPAGNMDLGGGIGIYNIFMIFVTGLVIAIALILPGISTSHMLLVLGMYDDLLGAITNFNITFLAVISISTAVGVFLITKPIEWTLRKFPHQTYYAIIGFVVGSISAIIRGLVLPAIPEVISLGWWAMMAPIAIVTFAMGYWAILSLSKFSNE
ncbi:MAG TPA: DUF368 domain-containing protein [Bacteroidales bacterium]|nr:DUF368 domain-containing protein [Bacteroidales bacterium]